MYLPSGVTYALDAALGRQRLDALKRRGVDDVHAARRLDDPHVHALPAATDRKIVGMAAQRNLLDHLECLAVDDVERAERLVADVDAAAIWCDCRTMVDLDPVNLSDDFVRLGIDDVNVVACAVGLNDHDFVRGARGCGG